MLPKAQVVGAGAAGIWMDKFMPPEFRALLPKGVQRNVWARIKPAKDDLGRDYMRVRWGNQVGQVAYEEDLDVFIARTGQVPFSFIHFPAPKGSGYEHLGFFVAEAFDLDFEPEYAIMDVNDNVFDTMTWDGQPLVRQFEGEQVIRLIDADSGRIKVITIDEWEAKQIQLPGV